MPVFVMDSCAMIAYLEDEQGAGVVQAILEDPANDCVAHFVNLSEVYKFYLMSPQPADAEVSVELLMKEAGITPQSDSDSSFWKSVARIWASISSTVSNPATGARYPIAMADCFAIALAQRLRGMVVTCDDEFTYVQTAGICHVNFFRPPGLRHSHGAAGS